MRPLSIAYLGKFQHLWDEESIALGLEQAGALVTRIDEGVSLSYVQRVVDRTRPDVFLGAKYQISESWKLLSWLREKKIPSASWTFDLIIGHPPREARVDTYAWLYTDLVVLTDGGNNEKYEQLGIHPKLLRQGIPDPYCYKSKKPTDTPAIIFVGTHNPTFPYREETMKFLKYTYGNKFKWYGFGDPNEVRGDELNNLYAGAKIIIGDSMYSPKYWSNRIYEVLGRGGFLIHPMIKGLGEEFIPYKEFIPYNWGDYAALQQKINYYLSNDREREQVANAGFAHVKQSYKMSQRCAVLHEMLCELASSNRKEK